MQKKEGIRMENEAKPLGLTKAGKKYLRIFRRTLCLPGGKRRQAIRELKADLGREEDYKELVSHLGTPENAALALNMSQEGAVYRKSPGRLPCLIMGIIGALGLLWTILLSWLGMLTLRQGELIQSVGDASVGIIGGADGPTAVFVASPPLVHSLLQLLPCLLIAIVGFLGWYRLRYWKDKK